MSGDQDKYHGTAEVVKDDFVCLRAEEFSEMLEAIEDRKSTRLNSSHYS